MSSARPIASARYRVRLCNRNRRARFHYNRRRDPRRLDRAPLRGAGAAQVAVIRDSRRADRCARHRREHRHLQRRLRHPASAAPLRRLGSSGGRDRRARLQRTPAAGADDVRARRLRGVASAIAVVRIDRVHGRKDVRAGGCERRTHDRRRLRHRVVLLDARRTDGARPRIRGKRHGRHRHQPWTLAVAIPSLSWRRSFSLA